MAETLAYNLPSFALPLPADSDRLVAASLPANCSCIAAIISGVIRSVVSGCFMTIMLIMSSLDTASRSFSCSVTMIDDAPRSLIVLLI